MKLRHLRCFLAVSEKLHLARAAEKLHIEQSPLSRAIKELEEDGAGREIRRAALLNYGGLAPRRYRTHTPGSRHSGQDKLKT